MSDEAVLTVGLLWIAAAACSVLLWARMKHLAQFGMAIVLLTFSWIVLRPRSDLSLAPATNANYVAPAVKDAYHVPGCPLATMHFATQDQARNANRTPCPFCIKAGLIGRSP